jgi:carbon-monoxide dehydrogenase medium subunit
VKPAPFEYHAPSTAAEVVELLAELGDGVKVLAGGQSLVPILSLRLTAFDHLVDLRKVDELRGIERTNGHVRVGSGTTQATIERADHDIPLLAAATPLIGHSQIRNRGTIGGSLAHADPAAEYPAVALALDAELDVLSPSGSRTVPAAEFFQGLWTTALADDELLTAVRFPVWDGPHGVAVEELARRHGDFAIAGACVAVGEGRCAIGLFGLGPTPVRATAAEAAVVDGATPEEAGRLAVDGLEDVPSDVHGSADHRRHVGAVMLARAVHRAQEDARA